MRILVLTGNALKGVKGEYEYNLCKHLEEKGIEIHDLALYGDNSHYCKNSKMANKPFGFLPTKIGDIFSPSIISEIQKDYDVIHLQGAFWSFIPLQVIIWKKILNIKTPIIMTTHAYIPEKQKMFFPSLKDAFRNFDFSMVINGIKCLPYRRLDKVLCQSEIERKFVIETFKIDEQKVTTIPNGVDLRRYEISTYNFKKKKSLKRKFMILYVGQLIKMKGIPYLFEAIKILKSRGYDCDLVLVSYNPKEDVLVEARSFGIENNVQIFTKLPEDDLISAYKSCDVFVLPSLSEGLPTVLLEAMAAKKPVVSTNVSGIPYLLQDGKNGLMVNPRDSEGLANKIQKLLTNEEMYKEISENGYKTILNKYSWDKVTNSIIEEYKRCLEI